MAAASENGTTENISTEPVVVDDDVSFGFQRPEMYTEKLTGSVNPYGRHVFLCYKSHEDWPARVESSDSDPLPKRLAGAIKDRKDDIAVKTLLTICESGDGTGLSDGDVLVFPDLIKYRSPQWRSEKAIRSYKDGRFTINRDEDVDEDIR